MNRRWALMLLCCVGCADVIGADFGAKGLERFDDFHPGGGAGEGGESATGGSGSADGGSGSVHSGGSGNGGSGGAMSGGSDTGGKSSGGGSAGGSSSGGTGAGGSNTGGGASGGSGTGGIASGGAGSGGASAALVINEVYAEGTYAFIELFNSGSSSIDIDDYQLVNGVGAPASSDRIDLSGSIGAGQYKVEAEGCVVVICDYFPFSIDTNGDTLWLLDGSGNVVDFVDYPDTDAAGGLDVSESYSRLPNGSGSFAPGKPTKGAQNQAP